jgi:hypothetical protein
MPTYLEIRAEAYGHREELEIDPKKVRACTSGWNITVIASMPQKGITMKIKPEVILGQQLALRADGFLEMGGPQEKMPFFQVAPGPILSSSNHSNSSQYGRCKVWLKKMTASLTAVPPKFSALSVQVTELVTDLFPLGTDPVLAFTRLKTTFDQFSHPYWTYIKRLSTFQWGMLAYKCTLTLLHC